MYSQAISVSFFLFFGIMYANGIASDRYQDRVIWRRPEIAHNLILRGTLSNVKNAPRCRFGICEHLTGYPYDLVKDVLTKTEVLHSYFGNIIEPLEKSISIQSRFDGDLDSEPFCVSKDETKIPTLMLDVDNVQRVMANVDGYTQVVKFQTCIEGGQCHAGSQFQGRTKCLQKYNVIKLLTVNQQNQTEYRKFQIPSTCVCAFI